MDSWYHLKPLADAVAANVIPGFFSRSAQSLPLPRNFPDGRPVELVPCGRGTLICLADLPGRLGYGGTAVLCSEMQGGRARAGTAQEAIALGPCREPQEGAVWLTFDFGGEPIVVIAQNPDEEARIREILNRIAPGAAMGRAEAPPPQAGRPVATRSVRAYLDGVSSLPEARRMAAYAIVAIGFFCSLFSAVALVRRWPISLTMGICTLGLAAVLFICWTNSERR